VGAACADSKKCREDACGALSMIWMDGCMYASVRNLLTTAAGTIHISAIHLCVYIFGVSKETTAVVCATYLMDTNQR
jgi:hypothetical protein